MNCLNCNNKTCKLNQVCPSVKFDVDKIKTQYLQDDSQKIIQAAAQLVDHGRAGTLSRLEETIEFIKIMEYQKVGVAYCFGLEQLSQELKSIMKSNGIKLTAITCCTGGVLQCDINKKSDIKNFSCNPLGQAEQLNIEGCDFVIILGICLGHDILLQRNLKCDFSTLLVKDRTKKMEL